MQIVIAIPRYEELQDFGGAEEALLRDVSGVPLLIRILATGIRAGGDSAVIVHREAVPSEVLRASALEQNSQRVADSSSL